MLSVIVIKSHLVTVFNNNRPNSKQTLILPVHIKSQLKVHKIVPRGGVFVKFYLPRGSNFAKFFCPGAGNLTTLKNFLGDQPGEDVGAWN